MFLKGYGQQRFLGILLGGVFFLSYVFRPNKLMQRLFPVPPELLLYTAWIVWSGLTGVLVSKSLEDFWITYVVILQVFAMVWIVYGILRMQKESANGIFIGLMCGSIVQIASVFLGIQSLAAGISEERVIGLTENPNALGFMMIWSVMAAFFLWGIPGRLQKWVRVGVIAYLPLCCYVLLTTASRKCLLGFLLLAGLWTMWASVVRKNSFGRALRLVAFILFVGLAASQFTFVMENTLMGQRFKGFFKSGGNSVYGSVEREDRYWMYVDGWNIFRKYPVCGVGLGNFVNYYWLGEYSHSDYIEPLATTGLIGFLLYHSFNIFLLLRTLRLIRRVRDPVVLYRLKMVIISIVVNMFLGTGSPHATSQHVYLLLTFFCVYTSELEGLMHQSVRKARLLRDTGVRQQFSRQRTPGNAAL